MANALTAFDAGAVRVDGSVGRPRRLPVRARVRRATWRSRTSCTRLEAMGVDTGIDLDRLIDAARLACELVGRPVESHVGLAGPRFANLVELSSES